MNIITSHWTTALMKRNSFFRKGKLFGVYDVCANVSERKIPIFPWIQLDSCSSRMKMIWIRVCQSMNNRRQQSWSYSKEINEPKIIMNIESFNSCHPSFTFSYFLFLFLFCVVLNFCLVRLIHLLYRWIETIHIRNLPYQTPTVFNVLEAFASNSISQPLNLTLIVYHWSAQKYGSMAGYDMP